MQLILSIAFLFFPRGANANPPITLEKHPNSKIERRLVWSDEFNYEGLADSTKWNYEEGSNRGVEMQYYTKNRIENASVGNGYLTITARKENFINPHYQEFRKKYPAKKYPAPYDKLPEDSISAWIRLRYDSIFHYTSASLTTKGKAGWQYGKIEVRAKVPGGKGMWPAIWMMGTNISRVSWPKCGEIDIMEFLGNDPSHIHGSVHYGDSITNKHFKKATTLTLKEPFNDFHVYSVEWDKSNIKFFCDDVMYHSFPLKEVDVLNPSSFHQPYYLIINLALGNGTWAGPIDNNAMPQKLLIDYVRIYQ